jgi:hypothetical protein
MIAIGSTVSTSSPGASSSVSLRADLARYEKQLSDCVNCASASTPEGKRNIQNLGAQISTLKAKLNTTPQADVTARESKSTGVLSAVGGRIDTYA